jgi:hypothetical protein
MRHPLNFSSSLENDSNRLVEFLDFQEFCIADLNLIYGKFIKLPSFIKQSMTQVN